MAGYESEHTLFMREWLKQHPEELRVTQEGRALWWDKSPEAVEAARRLEEDKVPRKPYYYDAN